MRKKYIVRLSSEERGTLTEIVKKFKGTSQKVRRAQILLKAGRNGIRPSTSTPACCCVAPAAGC